MHANESALCTLREAPARTSTQIPKDFHSSTRSAHTVSFAMHSNARNTKRIHKRRQKVQSWWPHKRKRGGRILDHVDTWPREKCETLHGVLRPAEASPRRHEDAENSQPTRRFCTQRALCFLPPFVFSAEEDFFLLGKLSLPLLF
jgi:hypothetical protein